MTKSFSLSKSLVPKLDEMLHILVGEEEIILCMWEENKSLGAIEHIVVHLLLWTLLYNKQCLLLVMNLYILSSIDSELDHVTKEIIESVM